MDLQGMSALSWLTPNTWKLSFQRLLTSFTKSCFNTISRLARFKLEVPASKVLWMTALPRKVRKFCIGRCFYEVIWTNSVLTLPRWNSGSIWTKLGKIIVIYASQNIPAYKTSQHDACGPRTDSPFAYWVHPSRGMPVIHSRHHDRSNSLSSQTAASPKNSAGQGAREDNLDPEWSHG